MKKKSTTTGISPERQQILNIYTSVMSDFRKLIMEEENKIEEIHNNSILYFNEELGTELPENCEKYFQLRYDVLMALCETVKDKCEEFLDENK